MNDRNKYERFLYMLCLELASNPKLHFMEIEFEYAISQNKFSMVYSSTDWYNIPNTLNLYELTQSLRQGAWHVAIKSCVEKHAPRFQDVMACQISVLDQNGNELPSVEKQIRGWLRRVI